MKQESPYFNGGSVKLRWIVRRDNPPRVAAELTIDLQARGDVVTDAVLGGEHVERWNRFGRRLDARTRQDAPVEMAVRAFQVIKIDIVVRGPRQHRGRKVEPKGREHLRENRRRRVAKIVSLHDQVGNPLPPAIVDLLRDQSPARFDQREKGRIARLKLLFDARRNVLAGITKQKNKRLRRKASQQRKLVPYLIRHLFDNEALATQALRRGVDRGKVEGSC